MKGTRPPFPTSVKSPKKTELETERSNVLIVFWKGDSVIPPLFRVYYLFLLHNKVNLNVYMDLDHILNKNFEELLKPKSE